MRYRVASPPPVFGGIDTIKSQLSPQRIGVEPEQTSRSLCAIDPTSGSGERAFQAGGNYRIQRFNRGALVDSGVREVIAALRSQQLHAQGGMEVGMAAVTKNDRALQNSTQLTRASRASHNRATNQGPQGVTGVIKQETLRLRLMQLSVFHTDRNGQLAYPDSTDNFYWSSGSAGGFQVIPAAPVRILWYRPLPTLEKAVPFFKRERLLDLTGT